MAQDQTVEYSNLDQQFCLRLENHLSCTKMGIDDDGGKRASTAYLYIFIYAITITCALWKLK